MKRSDQIYDKNINGKFVTFIQLEDIYVKIGHECFTNGTWSFGANMYNVFPLSKPSLTIIYGDYNNSDIEKLLDGFRYQLVFGVNLEIK